MELEPLAERAQDDGDGIGGRFPIPAKLNLLLFALQVSALVGLLLWVGRVSTWQGLLLVGFLYALVMNSAYSLIHEAEHNLFHPDRRINVGAGVVLALFFPAPFHLIRQTHLGHHLRNRSDDEAFDLYFKGQNPLLRFGQIYSTVSGFFWFSIAVGTLLGPVLPFILKSRFWKFDRMSESITESLNPSYWRWIQLESVAAIGLHALLIYLGGAKFLHYFLVLYAFGVMWSSMQYIHHFLAERDVRFGAFNLKSFFLFDWILLNHNWHLNHHAHPTVPWIYLPTLDVGERGERRSFWLAYLRLWRGPRFSDERVENRFAGKIIR